jgi:hypothetical protein
LPYNQAASHHPLQRYKRLLLTYVFHLMGAEKPLENEYHLFFSVMNRLRNP